ncbi:MAG: hypothetical protein HZB59_07845 [Ignavibacteriales bacterium]|nr:hypothetical protein [Ignavibacteriales bacterium]
MITKVYKTNLITITVVLFLLLQCLLKTALIAEVSFKPFKTTTPPIIDGSLDDAVWQSTQKVTGFKTFQPDFGKDMSVNTDAYLAYDEENLYFAFKCYESEPDKIKANVSGRDRMTGDDHVCLNLDTFGDQQTLTCFYVNPLGIQGDSKATSNSEDFSFDAVWESAGKIDVDGYSIEICIPLKSIRYSDQDPTTMRLTIQRKVTLRQENGTLPPLDPKIGGNFVVQGATVNYEGLKHYTLFELLPAYTYTHRETMEQGSLVPEERKGNISLNAKYGLTQNLILDGTYNPDFSQIEADAGQVDVNLRYEIYYPETRPFFLEGNENFQMSNGPTIIHTRKIVDPLAGAKVTGKIADGQTIAAMYAIDELNPLEYPDQQYAHFGIFRYKGDIGNGNYLGGLVADKEMKGHYNRAVAVDGQYRLTPGSTLSILGSYTKTYDEATVTDNNGHALCMNFNNFDRNLNYGVNYEKISENYSAEMGQMYRTGYSGIGGYFGPRLYFDSSVVLNIMPQISTYHLRDDLSQMWENSYSAHINGTFVNRINACAGYEWSTEVYQLQKFNTDNMHSSFSMQATRELNINLIGNYRNAIRYVNDPYPGYGWGASAGVSYQPISNIAISLSYNYSDFYRKSDDKKIFNYSIYRVRSTYQVNKYLFFRCVVEYNDYRKRLFTDFLASFTYIPGTVFYLGYGSIFQKTQWETDRYVPSNRFLETKRGLFLKVSYLWRM